MAKAKRSPRNLDPTPAAPSDGTVRVTLSKPVPAHGNDVSELVFREPLGSDMARCGNPVKLDFTSDPPEISHDEAKMSRMLSALASVPPSTIGALSGADWLECAWTITPFFIPGATR